MSDENDVVESVADEVEAEVAEVVTEAAPEAVVGKAGLQRKIAETGRKSTARKQELKYCHLGS